jgi:hypothetical protein
MVQKKAARSLEYYIALKGSDSFELRSQRVKYASSEWGSHGDILWVQIDELV